MRYELMGGRLARKIKLSEYHVRSLVTCEKQMSLADAHKAQEILPISLDRLIYGDEEESYDMRKARLFDSGGPDMQGKRTKIIEFCIEMTGDARGHVST